MPSTLEEACAKGHLVPPQRRQSLPALPRRPDSGRAGDAGHIVVQLELDGIPGGRRPSISSRGSHSRPSSRCSSRVSDTSARLDDLHRNEHSRHGSRRASESSASGKRSLCLAQIATLDLNRSECSRRSQSQASTSVDGSRPGSASTTCRPSSSQCSSCGSVSDELYGFEIGERVTTRNGPDAHGPWKDMGDGKISGPYKRRGMLNVVFEKGGEEFAIKAKNLTRLSDEAKPPNYSGKFAIGDPVQFAGQGRGIVVGHAGPDAVLVEFAGLSTRAVCVDLLTKSTKEDMDQHNAGVNSADRSHSKFQKPDKRTMTMDEYMKHLRKNCAWAELVMNTGGEEPLGTKLKVDSPHRRNRGVAPRPDRTLTQAVGPLI